MIRKYYQKQYFSFLLYLLPTLNYAFPLVSQIQANSDKAITRFYHQEQSILQQPLSSRIVLIAQQFVKKPYELGALGEGSNGYFDQYPLYRLDAFDCETYVDTVLALAFGHDLESFKQYMRNIRYHQGHISFMERNHFISLDWNPHNQSQGLIRDITQTIYPHPSMAKALVDKSQWYHHIASKRVRLAEASLKETQRRIHLLEEQGLTYKALYARIPYIPLNILFDQNDKPNQALFARIPQGAILEIVRPNWDLTQVIGTHLNVSHLGFVLRENKALYFLQASSINHEVSKTPLIEYLLEAKKSPTIRGINLQMAQEEHECRDGLCNTSS